MTSPADKYRRLDNLAVEGSSPDGLLRLVIRQGPSVTLSVRSAAIRDYDARRFEGQFTALLGPSFAAYFEARREIRGAKARAADDLKANGSSRRGWLRLGSRGLVTWRCVLADNAMDALDGAELIAEAQTAIDAVLADYASGLAQSRRQRFRHDTWLRVSPAAPRCST